MNYDEAKAVVLATVKVPRLGDKLKWRSPNGTSCVIRIKTLMRLRSEPLTRLEMSKVWLTIIEF